MLTLCPSSDIIHIVADSEATRYQRKCECAGTGRQARLRGVCQSTYGFKSRHSHHLLKCETNKYADVAEWQTR